MTSLQVLRTLVLATAAMLHPVAASDLSDEQPATDAEFFERHVRPLLAEKCFSCHGRGQTKGELSLDSRAGVMAGGESGGAVVPGKPEESLLIEAIRYAGGMEMPPDAKLSDREIAVLTQWVALGAPWPDDEAAAGAEVRSQGVVSDQDRQFWSFRPVRQPPLPSVSRVDWPRQPLDHFILHRLEAEGLEPVEEADRRTYIRRASFDLRGLPPSEAEVAAFIADQRPDAYEQLIERLLDAPQYGERWARHWLDIARYGEDQAHTFQARLYPQGYRYRDWVIDSLNRDMPIDQFLLEQIAADLIAREERERMRHLPALGFFALGPVYYADAGCAPKAKADEYDDRIDTLSRGMLGLTVACARCHDHKFDPIATEDYYALIGVFASTEYVEAPLAPPDVVKAYEDAQAEIERAELHHKEVETEAARELGESFAPRTGDYLMAAWRVQNRRKRDPESTPASPTEGSDLHAFLVDRWLQYLDSERGREDPLFAPWRELIAAQDATRDLAGDAAAVAAVQQTAAEIQSRLMTAIDARREAQAKYRQQMAAGSEAETKPDEPALPDDTAKLLRRLVDDDQAPLAIPKDRLQELLPEERKQALAGLKEVVEARKNASPPKYPAAHSLKDGDPTNSKVHIRGNVEDLGEEVPRRFLAVLSSADPSPFTQGSGRLELAQAIISPENPLTARVFVNRVWQHHFGRGIVGSPSNFGLLGERPTHPELLDYLASRFIASGWSLKQLHRDIMLSATYRLASTGSAANQQRDPGNRLLWRMNRRRLDIEAWRDAALAVADRLDSSLGGPSFDLSANESRRRTLYAAVSRHELNPVLRLFDFPDPNLTSARRSLTTVPMQQLFVLNSEFMIGQSRALVARLEREDLPDDDARVDRLYRWVFGRPAQEYERTLARDYLQQSAQTAVDASRVKLSRWEQYAQALLSTNEFLFVD